MNKQNITSNSTSPNKISVILASNNRLFREGITKILNEDENVGIISQFCDPIELIQSCQYGSFDILLICLDLQGLKLSKLLRMLKKKNGGKVLLVIDRQFDEDELVEAISLGLRGYVLKDSNSMQLRKAIKAVHEGQLWIERRISDRAIDAFLGSSNHKRRSRKSTFYDLTNSELGVVKMVLNGHSNKEIAHNMYLSEKTVKFHLYKVFRKLSLKSRSELIIYCFRNGISN